MWLRNKRATINPKNKNDDNCFQHTLIVALNHQNIRKDPQRIFKIKLFIDQYNWKDFPSRSKQKSLNKTMRQLSLIFYVYHTILKK